MPELLPFRNFHYKMGRGNQEILKELVTPPYDVISEEEKIAFKKRHPDNICHIILPDNYETAGKKLKEMINNGTLVCEQDRCICIYGIDYVRPDTGEKVSRYGFVGLLKLVEIFPAKDSVIPHEMTFMKFIDDRLRIIQETDSNFSPIFTIYNGKHGDAEKVFKKYINTPPFLQTIDRDGFTHKIWEVWKKKDIERFKEIVKNNTIIIADGHHRYITALKHSKEDGGCKYIMALFIDFNDPGLIIYTAHREISKIPIKTIDEFKDKIKDFFKIKDIENYENLKDLMEKKKGKHIFGCYFQNKYLYLKLKNDISPEKHIQSNQSKEWKNLNLPILHEILFKCLQIDKDNITYVKDVKEGIENVDKGKIQALFIVNPTTLTEVQKITTQGKINEIMPHKSTYFYPKPLSGLVIHKHTNEIE